MKRKLLKDSEANFEDKVLSVPLLNGELGIENILPKRAQKQHTLIKPPYFDAALNQLHRQYFKKNPYIPKSILRCILALSELNISNLIRDPWN